eukprot:363740-Chlamydomonas_euryale.AAC.10
MEGCVPAAAPGHSRGVASGAAQAYTSRAPCRLTQTDRHLNQVLRNPLPQPQLPRCPLVPALPCSAPRAAGRLAAPALCGRPWAAARALRPHAHEPGVVRRRQSPARKARQSPRTEGAR